MTEATPRAPSAEARRLAGAVVFGLGIALIFGVAGFALIAPALALLYVAAFAVAVVVVLVRLG